MIGAGELVVIVVLLLLLFGWQRLPELGRGLGEGLSAFRNASGEAAPAAPGHDEGIEPLVVFISSRMEELSRERDVVERAVRTFRFTRPWRFERTPASSQSCDEISVANVRRSDVVLFVLGETLSQGVLSEHHAAREAGVHRLYFVKRGKRTRELEAFIRQDLDVRYAEFGDARELERAAISALWALFVDSVRRRNNPYRLQLADLSVLLLLAEAMQRPDDDEEVADLRNLVEDQSDERRELFEEEEEEDYCATADDEARLESEEEEEPEPPPDVRTMFCARERRMRQFTFREHTVDSAGSILVQLLSAGRKEGMWQCNSCSAVMGDGPCTKCGTAPTLYEPPVFGNLWTQRCPKCGFTQRIRFAPKLTDLLKRR